jgi:hypothetical protein
MIQRRITPDQATAMMTLLPTAFEFALLRRPDFDVMLQLTLLVDWIRTLAWHSRL